MNERTKYKVAANTDPGKLAGAIAEAVRNEENVQLLSVGAGAVNQAVKSVAVANGMLAPRGEALVIAPAFRDFDLEGEERTAMLLTLKQIG